LSHDAISHALVNRILSGAFAARTSTVPRQPRLEPSAGGYQRRRVGAISATSGEPDGGSPHAVAGQSGAGTARPRMHLLKAMRCPRRGLGNSLGTIGRGGGTGMGCRGE
jgi:hypothetical protein